MLDLPKTVVVLVEVPRFSFVKRRVDGRCVYFSPIPAPFNYGSIPTIDGGDGDPLDAVLLGPHRSRGSLQTANVLGMVHFIDAGEIDDKVVCGTLPLRRRDWLLVNAFFICYPLFKGPLNMLRLKRGPTRYLGWTEY
ncbi:MAG TPA: inorganic diphosphatase [Myxococcota bacterium]|jgi:inorganic pyrophosphatase